MRKIEPVEILDLYLEDGTMTDEVQARGQKIPNDRYHLCVHVWIRSAQGQFLVAQRAADRKSNPNQWECPGGHVIAKESSLQGALREVKEEIGVFN